MERDSLFNSNLFKVFHFNSHAHVERDGRRHNQTKGHSDFNSHAHVERDVIGTAFKEAKDISTHTLTWSVTSENRRPNMSRIFQLTRSRGA